MRSMERIKRECGDRLTLLSVGPAGFAARLFVRNVQLQIIASWGGGWDHVSVSLPDRCPTWLEMDNVKRIFFARDETAMQLHPPDEKRINTHNYCLHIWRPQKEHIPMPPRILV